MSMTSDRLRRRWSATSPSEPPHGFTTGHISCMHSHPHCHVQLNWKECYCVTSLELSACTPGALPLEILSTNVADLHRRLPMSDADTKEVIFWKAQTECMNRGPDASLQHTSYATSPCRYWRSPTAVNMDYGKRKSCLVLPRLHKTTSRDTIGTILRALQWNSQSQ